MKLVVETPAKINLTLRVLDRRPDGYHELDTVFQAIDLWDTLTLEPADGISLTTDHPSLATDESNLVCGAARMLRERFSVNGGVRVHLRKRIPIEGGLGGGSSDAAATLLGCARLWGLPAGRTELESLARELGADVAFFLYGGTARGSGRGDRITPLEPFGEYALLLARPPFGISTADAYRRAAEWLTLPAKSVNFPALFGHKWKHPNDLAVLANDLERSVFEARPELRSFRDGMLAAGATRALLSGSGSTVFGLFEEVENRDRAIGRLGATYGNWEILPSRTLDVGVRIRAG